MTKLSARGMFIYKRVFPALWFGFLFLFEVLMSLGVGKKNGVPLPALLMPILMAFFGYLMMRHYIFDLIDEVYDDGDSLLFRNSNKEVRIRLADVKNVSYTTLVNPPRVTITVRQQTEFGRDLSFSPKASIIPFKKNQDIVNLIDRIDKARG